MRALPIVALLCALPALQADSNIEEVQRQPADTSVDWQPLIKQSLTFLAIQHTFRVATEPGTRNGFRNSYFKGYARSVSHLHGWADGDPFYVNYVGHPMQGAAASFLWVQNDRKYRHVEFGKNRDYWRSRLRAAAFSAAYSAQFEVGPLSEASLGHIQSRFPQHGFVDHVVTPVIGLGWQIAEDALDKYVIRSLEDRFENNWMRLLVRGGLNPSRSFANVLRGRSPWHRDTREGVLAYRRASREPTFKQTVEYQPQEIAPLEFTTAFLSMPIEGLGCLGGGAELAYRLTPSWQAVGTVGGCKIAGLRENVSGDALQYLAGFRWTPRAASRWSPYAHLMVGGIKTTQEVMDPKRKEFIEKLTKGRREYTMAWKHAQYTATEETNKLTWTAGVGVDYRITRALAFRAFTVDLARCCTLPMERMEDRHTVRVSSGLVLRMGTW